MENLILAICLRKFYELTNQYKNILDINVVKTRIANDVTYEVQ